MHALLNILESKSLAELYREFGIKVYEENSTEVVELSVKKSSQKRQLSRQDEIGNVGTYIIDGRLQVEQNARLRPYYARGRMSRPGELEKIYRSEPVAFNSVNSVNALVRGATFEPTANGTMDAETALITIRASRSLSAIDGGFSKFLRDATTVTKMGFAVFEQVWESFPVTDSTGEIVGQEHYIAALKFREQATVDRWMYEARAQDLVGAEFMTSGSQTLNYFLPHGTSPATARLGVITVHGSGNNIEGVSPVRVMAGLRALKELLLNVSGLSYQKYGVPIIQIIQDLLALNAAQMAGQGSSAQEMQTLANQLNAMQAKVAPIVNVPAGAKVEFASPTNAMPDIKPMLEYLDGLMALCFSNEGSLLGSGSFGSYAMASVADDRFMRAAPVYAESIAEYLTSLLNLMIRWNHSDISKITTWPEYTFRFGGTQDASRWAADMMVLVSAQVWTWPEEPRHAAAVNMGLSPTAFDTWQSTATVADVSGQQVAP